MRWCHLVRTTGTYCHFRLSDWRVAWPACLRNHESAAARQAVTFLCREETVLLNSMQWIQCNEHNTMHRNAMSQMFEQVIIAWAWARGLIRLKTLEQGIFHRFDACPIKCLACNCYDISRMSIKECADELHIVGCLCMTVVAFVASVCIEWAGACTCNPSWSLRGRLRGSDFMVCFC